ncbi:MAG: urate hydroxylase PuuD [Alphaproteobacteria bacterium]
MASILVDWASLLLRWAHVMTGIAWIGTSFFFIWLDASLRKRDPADTTLAGESWMVHGGGFFRAEKYLVAPAQMPAELHWFKYEAYFTWITGMALLGVIYYWGADVYLIDAQRLALQPWQAISISVASLLGGWVVYDLVCKSPIGAHRGVLALVVFALIAAAAVFYGVVFSGRAAFVHIGAFFGTIMVANVAHVIIPNQRIVVADLQAGRTPDASLGQQAGQRSLHNNYLTLPVVFMMISSHYPVTYGHENAWVIALGVVLASGLLRHFLILQSAGKLDWRAKAALPASGLVGLAVIVFASWQPQAAPGEAVDFAEIRLIVQTHCAACHTANPSDEDFTEPPNGVVFDTPADLRKYAAQIRAQAVLTNTMPLGNKTGISDDERAALGNWIAQGAPIK